MQINPLNGKKILTTEEYNNLSENKKKKFKEIHFDENMGPGDDIDYSYRVYRNAFKLGIIDYWVQHHRLTEHGDVDTQKKQQKMSRYFKKKWAIE